MRSEEYHYAFFKKRFVYLNANYRPTVDRENLVSFKELNVFVLLPFNYHFLHELIGFLLVKQIVFAPETEIQGTLSITAQNLNCLNLVGFNLFNSFERSVESCSGGQAPPNSAVGSGCGAALW